MNPRMVGIALIVSLCFMVTACKTPATQNSQNGATAQTPSSEEPAGNMSQSASQPSASQPAQRQHAQAAKPAPAPAAPVVVPAGTVLTVRLGESVGSKISQTGQSFSASVVNPVQVDGKTVIPSGANATGTVVSAKPLGRFKGGAELSLKLTSVSFNGSEHVVETSSVVEVAKGKGKRSATMIGGGAGLGAIVGAIAGGGKGAAIGAAAGAGAGTAGTAFTGNKDIVLPAETALTFKLATPLEVK